MARVWLQDFHLFKEDGEKVDMNWVAHSIFAMHTHNDQKGKNCLQRRQVFFIYAFCFLFRPRLAIRNRYKREQRVPEYLRDEISRSWPRGVRVPASFTLRLLWLHQVYVSQCTAASLPRSPITYTSSFCISQVLEEETVAVVFIYSLKVLHSVSRFSLTIISRRAPKRKRSVHNKCL